MVMSAEPDPKPPELASSATTPSSASTASYPNAMPKGFVADARSGTGRIKTGPHR